MTKSEIHNHNELVNWEIRSLNLQLQAIEEQIEKLGMQLVSPEIMDKHLHNEQVRETIHRLNAELVQQESEEEYDRIMVLISYQYSLLIDEQKVWNVIDLL
jgi:hypothetical protein